MVRIRLLGGVGAVTDDGRPVDVGPAKCQAVLAALALSAGAAVPVSRIVELVWGEVPPRTAEKTLQSYVTRLRKGLGQDAIVRVGAAYRLDVEPESVDALRFQRRLDAGDVESALAEWGGPPLAGLEAEGLGSVAEGLVERWLGALELDLERRVERDPPAAIGALTELTARYPFREGLWALLMVALYRVGRQADALQTYRTAREHLVGRLGVEPGPRLREVEALVLSQDERLTAGVPGEGATGEERAARLGGDEHPPSRSEGAPRGNLPRRMGRLIGRDGDLRLVGDALSAAPVVTLVGPGGIGKTRLALASARTAEADLGGGAWLVELAGISSPEDVPRAVADALGVREGHGRTLTESIVVALASRQALIVLDNCEHVIAGAADMAHAIAEGCPEARVLATSREGLGLGEERLVSVAPLDPAGPGVELFVERARAVDHSFDPDAQRDQVEEICRRLDGVPLAIELAAARVRSLPPADLLERLGDRLRLLTGGRRPGGERHRTLRATIGWSYDLLAAPERTVFDRLSIFAGPFDLSAAETVAASGDLDAVEVDDVLGGLVERSMLVAESGPFGRRFRLLETMRQFGMERLSESGGADAVADRHTAWVLDRLAIVNRLLAGPGEIEGVARLAELWPNLRAAVDRACASGDRRLARALVRPVVSEVMLRSQDEIGDWVERILAMTPVGDREAIVFGLTWAAQRYAMDQDPEGYERLVRRHGEPDDPMLHHARAFVYEDYEALERWAPRAVDELRRRGDHDLAELFEIDVGAALLNLGRLSEHDAIVSRLADRYRVQGPPTLLNWTLMLLGYSALFQGDQERADRLFGEAVDVGVPERTHSPNRPIEARTALRRGDPARAALILRAHVEELLDTGNMQGASIACVELVDLMASTERLPEAARMLGYLETTGLLEAPGFRSLVADAADRIAAGADPSLDRELAAGRELDDRGALAYMRDALAETGA